MINDPELQHRLTNLLKNEGVDDASQDVRFILQAASTTIEAEEMVSRRLKREPLSHILGEKPFWTLDLNVSSEVLTPRADTEALVEAVLKRLECKDKPLDLADFGTGSGAILLALLSELPHAKGMGFDISESALDVARSNALRNGLHERAGFQLNDWAAGVSDEMLDLAVSNPPYIASHVISTLEPEVRDFEPSIALDGGQDGLDVYRHLMPELFRILRTGGLMAVEIGYDQGKDVFGLASDSGFERVECIQDLSGNDRVVLGWKPHKPKR